MYLHNATGLDEIISFGIDPLVVLMEIFEDEFMDFDDPASKEAILWNEIKGKALLTQESIKEIHAAKKLKKR